MKKAAIVAAILSVSLSVSASTITYVDLLDQMTDLVRLATLPQPGETCKQFSSYDRRSVSPDNPESWAANGDAGNFLRKDPEGMVLADMDGPGCIFRIWSANPEGILKVFIDKQKKPVLQCGFQDIVNGKVPPFLGPVVGRRALGANLYFPIPYQKHCRVVVENPKALYYHVTYRTYPSDTQIESFHLPLRDDELAKLKDVISQLEGRGKLPHDLRGVALNNPMFGEETFTLEPGQTAQTGSENDGPPVALCSTKFRFLNLPDDLVEQRKMLARTIMRIYWDGQTAPSVDVPIGDFFGTAPGVNPYKSLPLGMEKDGTAYCYWYMPYKRSIRVEFENQGDKAITFHAQAIVERCSIPPDQIAYFHARWHRDYPNKTFDWPFLKCEGRGRFCGVVLTIWNPVRGWWGEGDEKFWVDGESFPSTFGTGSEDYFGYAWCNTTLFQHAFHNQTICEGPGNGNYTSVNRWHIADNIPFQKSFFGTIENYGNDKDYSCVTYWYANLDQKDSFQPVDVRDRVIHEPTEPFRIEGAIEGESLKVLGKSDDMEAGVQDISGFGEFSNDNQMWLRGNEVGSWAELGLPEVAAGAYKMTIFPVTSWDYALIQVSVNGEKFGKPYDSYTPQVLRGKPIVLDRVLLKGRGDVLRVDMVGKNGKSTGYFFGIDAIRLEPLR